MSQDHFQPVISPIQRPIHHETWRTKCTCINGILGGRHQLGLDLWILGRCHKLGARVPQGVTDNFWVRYIEIVDPGRAKKSQTFRDGAPKKPYFSLKDFFFGSPRRPPGAPKVMDFKFVSRAHLRNGDKHKPCTRCLICMFINVH